MYYIVFGLLYLFSLLPFFILHAISDVVAFLLYHVVRYRKDIVFENLKRAFPGKTDEERKKIAKQFYRNFTDSWLETIKLISISVKRIGKRISTNLQCLHDLYPGGRNANIFMGHQFNWEYCNASVPVRVPYTILVAYSPIGSKILDRLFLYIRQRFGCILLPFNDMKRAMLPYRHKQHMLALVADQSPPVPSKCYWLNFLNTPTPFLKGPERGARIGNVPVVFMSLSKTKRGYYHIQATMLNENPGETKEGEITKQYITTLEGYIHQQPELYLWSHKRWKHPWKDEYAKLWVDPVVPSPAGL